MRLTDQQAFDYNMISLRVQALHNEALSEYQNDFASIDLKIDFLNIGIINRSNTLINFKIPSQVRLRYNFIGMN